MGGVKNVAKSQLQRLPQYLDDLSTKGFKGVLSDVGSNLLSDSKSELRSQIASRTGQGRGQGRSGGFLGAALGTILPLLGQLF